MEGSRKRRLSSDGEGGQSDGPKALKRARKSYHPRAREAVPEKIRVAGAGREEANGIYTRMDPMKQQCMQVAFADPGVWYRSVAIIEDSGFDEEHEARPSVDAPNAVICVNDYNKRWYLSMWSGTKYRPLYCTTKSDTRSPSDSSWTETVVGEPPAPKVVNERRTSITKVARTSMGAQYLSRSASRESMSVLKIPRAKQQAPRVSLARSQRGVSAG